MYATTCEPAHTQPRLQQQLARGSPASFCAAHPNPAPTGPTSVQYTALLQTLDLSTESASLRDGSVDRSVRRGGGGGEGLVSLSKALSRENTWPGDLADLSMH